MTAEREKQWHDFRRFAAAKLKECEDLAEESAKRFFRDLRTVCLDLDYEGPPICGGIYQSLHEMWEEGKVEAESWGVSEEQFWQDDCSFLHDWAMNAHPGLCPDDVAKALVVFL